MDKKKFVLRLNQETYNKLEKWAGDEFRSVNGQIEWILQDSLNRHRRGKEENLSDSSVMKINEKNDSETDEIYEINSD